MPGTNTQESQKSKSTKKNKSSKHSSSKKPKSSKNKSSGPSSSTSGSNSQQGSSSSTSKNSGSKYSNSTLENSSKLTAKQKSSKNVGSGEQSVSAEDKSQSGTYANIGLHIYTEKGTGSSCVDSRTEPGNACPPENCIPKCKHRSCPSSSHGSYCMEPQTNDSCCIEPPYCPPPPTCCPPPPPCCPEPKLTCCSPPPKPPPLVYRPDRCCFERVQGPFKRPIPKAKPYPRYAEKFRDTCGSPPTCSRQFKAQPMPCFSQPSAGCCCDDIRKLKACKAELKRLKKEKCMEQLRRQQEQDCMVAQYQEQMCEWERVQEKCERDRQRRKLILQNLLCQRQDFKRLKEEARMWRSYQQKMLLKRQKEEEELWLQEYAQREDERLFEEAKLREVQEKRYIDAQTRVINSEGMAVPELEELRRMFIPVEKEVPKETFEYYVVEPQPTQDERRRNAEEQMRALMGLRNEHGIRLCLGDKGKKKTTIKVAMGPKLSNGERLESCKVINTPGALCENICDDAKTPNVVIPECLKPLMQTLSYRVSEIDTPLLSMKSFECDGEGDCAASSNVKEVALQGGPNFNGSRLYGTIVLPKGKILTDFYTKPYNVTF